LSAIGNLTSDGVFTYTYDENRLVSAAKDQNSFTFSYNGLGDRYQQTVNGQTTTYSLDLAAEEAIRCLTSQEGASYSCATIDKAVRAMSQEEQKELSRNILQFFMLAGLY